MHRIVNLTRGPFDLQTLSGRVMLPALGEVTDEFAPELIDALRLAGSVKVLDVAATKPVRKQRRPRNAANIRKQ